MKKSHRQKWNSDYDSFVLVQGGLRIPVNKSNKEQQQ